MDEILTPQQMGLADKYTIEGGVPGIDLMNSAGAAVAHCALKLFREARHVLVVCGIGNNGGDGLVAARILVKSGLRVNIVFVGEQNRLRGDAALAFQALPPAINIIPDVAPDQYDLLIDAIFGAGLDRNVARSAAETIDAINASDTPVIAVDLPSGIDGATGQVRGTAVNADATVTFFRKNPGHILLPGRIHCGEAILHQIGIRSQILEKTGIAARLNRAALWQDQLPRLAHDGHKYTRGSALVISGPLPMSGASRLVASAALRVGAGLVTIACAGDVMAAHAAQLTSIMLSQADSADDIRAVLTDSRINCVVMGPGMPPDKQTRACVTAVLAAHRKTVLDAGALAVFDTDSDSLFSQIRKNPEPVVLTPHEGEFQRLFKDQRRSASKIERAIQAAKLSGATMVLKGPDTVVATPDGAACIADNAPPWLATAGSGDVLAGSIGGLLAQGMPAYEAAAAAVWINGDAAARLGPPLVSSDMDEGLRRSMAALLRDRSD